MHDIIEFLWLLKNILLALGAIAIVFYTGWYFLLANWRKYPAGRRVLGFTSSLVAVLAYILLALYDGNTFFFYPASDPSLWRIILGVVVYGAVAYSSIRLDITLVYSWHRGEVHDPRHQNPFVPDERTDRRIRRAQRPNGK